MPEQLEESLDDNEKLLDIVDESNTLCGIYKAQSSSYKKGGQSVRKGGDYNESGSTITEQ